MDLNKLFFSDDEGESNESALSADEIIAQMWREQVESFDSLPRKPWPRRYVKFSPSQADNCLRELYFINTNATADVSPVTPWKVRRARNGDGYHMSTQKAYLRMVEALRSAGVSPKFEVLAMEVDGSATYDVTLEGTTYNVIIEGRCDIVLRYVGESVPGVIERGDTLLLDLKAKAKLSGVNKIKRMGVPESNRQQMVAYSLLRFRTKDGKHTFNNINKAILHYESLEKMKESEERPVDVLPIVVHATETDQRNLLVRFARVVEAIETNTVPEPQFDRCAFCSYKSACQEIESKKRGEAS